MPNFTVIGAEFVQRWLYDSSTRLLDITLDAYKKFHGEKAVNPDSYFLRFPDNPNTRIIALPASSESEPAVAGVKWIASFPDNIHRHLDRASAVIILNDRRTGYPLACLEGSLISCYRTAASALVGANLLHTTPQRARHMVIVGCGLIAYTTVGLMLQTGWAIEKLTLVDLSEQRSGAFANKLMRMFREHRCTQIASGGETSVHIEQVTSLDPGINTDLILFATSAITPYVNDKALLQYKPTILHMSLRDLGVDIITSSQNFVDDVEHAVKANVSLHLAEQFCGHRDFISGNVVQVDAKEVIPDFSKARIYSPFGMGIIDLLVAYAIFQSAHQQEPLHSLPAQSEAGRVAGVTLLEDFFPIPHSQQGGTFDVEK